MTSTPDHISRTNRRSFLHRAFCGAVVSLGTARPGLHTLSSAGKRISTIGLQLYTVRRELEKDFAGTLEKLAALGFREVEFAGYFKHSPQEAVSYIVLLVVQSAHFNPGTC